MAHVDDISAEEFRVYANTDFDLSSAVQEIDLNVYRVARIMLDVRLLIASKVPERAGEVMDSADAMLEAGLALLCMTGPQIDFLEERCSQIERRLMADKGSLAEAAFKGAQGAEAVREGHGPENLHGMAS